jgi:ABC-2 type transport system permease protein
VTSLDGTRTLVWLALRRDRIMVPTWIAALVVTMVGSAASYANLYTTPESLRELTAGIGDNAATLAIYGPVYDVSIGGLTAWKPGVVALVLVALMNLLVIGRHTRGDEEAGRLELVGAGVVGRNAPLAAALLVALAADVVIAVATTIGTIAVGLPAEGSLALGLAMASAGVMFAAVAAVAAQVTESARTANGLAAGVLGVSYLVRAVGDATKEGWVGWLSPIGWAQQIRPFADERWWVLGLVALLTVSLVATAVALLARRDLGAGLLPPRPGPANGGPRLRSALALAWRLQRTALIGWSVAFVTLGTVAGLIAQSIGDLVKSNSQVEQFLRDLGGRTSLEDAYLASVFGVMGLVAAAYSVQATLRLRQEETALRAEPVLATAVGRIRWVLSHVTFAAGGAALLLVLAGLAAGVAHGLQTGDVGTQVSRLLGAALAQLPAALVIGALALALFGLAPQAAPASWGALVACLLLAEIGPLVGLGQWVLDISPFAHVPKLPGGDASAATFAWLTLAAAAIAAAGLAGFRRRDVG